MCAEIKKLVWFIIKLSIFGTLLGFFSAFPSAIIPIFNLFSLLSLVVEALIIITIAVLCTYVIIIVTISNPISRIGEYYKFEGSTSKYREPAMTNFKIILINNIFLTVPLYFAFIYLLNPSNFLIFGSNYDLTKGLNEVFTTTIATLPGFLLSIRLLTHPVKNKSSIPLLGTILGSIRDHYSKNCTSMEVLKERFLSFYFSLIASAFFAMAMLYLYKSIPLASDPSTFYLQLAKSLAVTFIPSFDPDPLFNASRIVFYWVVYLCVLVLFTLFGEWILDNYKLLEE